MNTNIGDIPPALVSGDVSSNRMSWTYDQPVGWTQLQPCSLCHSYLCRCLYHCHCDCCHCSEPKRDKKVKPPKIDMDRVKEIEYNLDGTIRRVVFKD